MKPTPLYPIGARTGELRPAPGREESFFALAPRGARVEIVANGFGWAEGPVWVPEAKGGHLLFSDTVGNAIWKWTEAEGARMWMPRSGFTDADGAGPSTVGPEPGSNGLARDREGRLLLCEHGDRRVSMLTPGQGKRTLADRFEGKRLNSPNDIVVDSRGRIYFTDPPYGLAGRFADPARELDFCGVFRIDVPEGDAADAGRLTLLTREVSAPNGLAFSPDESVLYVSVSDPKRPVWLAFSHGDDGSLGDSRVFADVSATYGQPGMEGSPDGFKVDIEGNLFAAGPGGLHIFDAGGELLGRMHLGHAMGNCAWGEEGATLFLTMGRCVGRLRLSTRGG